MPSDTFEYKCPNCGGPLKFDPARQKLACPYCDSTFTEAEVQAHFAAKEQAAANAVPLTQQNDQYSQEEASHMRAYSCPSCGANLYAADTTAVTLCPYCGNTNIIASQFKAKKPSSILPFQITKQQAEEALRTFYQGKAFLPKAFSSENHIQKVQSVYVPFWLYDANISIDALYDAVRIREYPQGEDIITETDHFRLVRRGNTDFHYVPADASKEMKDEYMDSLEPFDCTKLVPFQTSYMAGCLADSYDVTTKENQARAEDRMIRTTQHALDATTVSYGQVIRVAQNIRPTKESAEYVFLPVWMLATTWHGKTYQFAINGQSGKVVGELPADSSAFLRSTLILFLIFFAVFALVAYGMAGGF
ncbi:MAG: hypothetical protein PUC87_02545 [Galactobacillus timonensis]|uniref:hypothetical protein n=1 Tax=Galactobacillus timonensis TaxID=2041840 RepID=UPI002409CCEB|nr:hypothetical protein [Galactobacillus timonensis]MDD5851016.1 hypothetical protein [Galactobacillus timonensis]MDD6679703.1 hypothetical protein [Galactobacillus timonensis]